MEAEFWIKAWNEGRTAFHQRTYNETLLKHFPGLAPKPGERVLVPLCGKSKDLLWLRNLGLQVRGVELHEKAVADFFGENQLFPVQKDPGRPYINYSHLGISIGVGDFFLLDSPETFDLAYDRAALVALPAAMRRQYAQVLTRSLKRGARMLLLTYVYDQAKMDGPPFSVTTEEIQELFGSAFSIEPLDIPDTPNESARLAAIGGLKQDAYRLKKKA